MLPKNIKVKESIPITPEKQIPKSLTTSFNPLATT
jgi:hypothetical protein